MAVPAHLHPGSAVRASGRQGRRRSGTLARPSLAALRGPLADALDVLEDQHAEMRRRLRTIAALCGQRNAWNADGPTEDLPLLVTVIDECQTYLDLAQHKGDRALEGLARRCIALTGELIRKGRSVLCLTILATQKTTGDSIPTSLRDNSGLAVSFALKTTESSVAALGDAIREYPG